MLKTIFVKNFIKFLAFQKESHFKVYTKHTLKNLLNEKCQNSEFGHTLSANDDGFLNLNS